MAIADWDSDLGDVLRDCHAILSRTLERHSPRTVERKPSDLLVCRQLHGWVACLGHSPPRDSTDVWVVKVLERPGTELAAVESGSRKLAPIGLVQRWRSQAREVKLQFCERHFLYHVTARDYWDDLYEAEWEAW